MTPFFFDCLHLDGEDLLDRPYSERVSLLEARVPEESRIPRIETADSAEGEAFLDAALARGHEGVLVKSLGSPYEAGRRGAGWVKVKRAQTLDLVVLAAEWGHGRRQGRLSNLHLGARDPSGGGFVMLGKTFKGMTDDDARLADRAVCSSWPPSGRATSSTSGPSSSSRSPSTACSAARGTRVGSRSGSRASRATAPTRRRPRRTRSTPSVRSSRARAAGRHVRSGRLT